MAVRHVDELIKVYGVILHFQVIVKQVIVPHLGQQLGFLAKEIGIGGTVPLQAGKHKIQHCPCLLCFALRV